MLTYVRDEPPFDEFMLAYGRALAAWAGIEYQLFLWFYAITGMAPDMAGAVFFSMRSFSAKHDLLKTTASRASLSQEDIGIFINMLNISSNYSSARNSLAHSIPSNIGDDYSKIQLIDPAKKSKTLEISITMLHHARNNFQTLSDCLSSIWINVSPPGRLGLQTPEHRRAECSQILLKLPRDAFASPD